MMAEMYQTDYVIAWNFEDGDVPFVKFTKVYAEKGKAYLMCDVLGCSHEHSGVVSLRQLLDENDRQKQNEYCEKEDMNDG